MSRYVKVARVLDIPVNGMKAFEVEHTGIVICNIDDEFFAFQDECSHDSAPISTGHLIGKEVVCPRHGARFDITSGAVTGPPAVAPIDTFEIKIESDDIYILFE